MLLVSNKDKHDYYCDEDKFRQMVHVKELELKEVQESRFKLLEDKLLEREKLIEEYIELISSLKTDFEYNIRLLQARDIEISRLETQVISDQEQFQLYNDERKELLSRIDLLTQREIIRLQNIENEKTFSKVK